MEWTFLGIWVLLTVLALWDNYRESNLYIIHVDLNTFKTNLFELGISNRHWHEDGNCITTYNLGFFFFTISIDFLYIEEDEG